LEWFRSYLDRTQQVKFDGNKWFIEHTEHGVPQRSILGPLLFIIYINDIVCPNKCNIKMFADDKLIYVSGNGSKELERKTNVVFNIIEKWLSVNKLKMNAERTKYTIVRSIRKEQRGEIILRRSDGTQIEKIETVKYLGIIIDNRLCLDFSRPCADNFTTGAIRARDIRAKYDAAFCRYLCF